MPYQDDLGIIDTHLALAMEAAGLELWENNPVTGTITPCKTHLFAELGYDVDESARLAADIFTIVHEDDVPVLMRALSDHLGGLTPHYRCEYRLRAKGGAWVWFANHGMIADRSQHQDRRFISVAFNIDERKRKEAEHDTLARALRLLSQCSTALIHAQDEQSFLDTLCKLTVETGGYRMACIGFADDDATDSLQWQACHGDNTDYLKRARITRSDSEFGRGPSGSAFSTGATVVNQDFQTNPTVAPWHAAALASGFRSSIALPLTTRGQVFGVFCAYASDPFSFTEAEVGLLEELAKNIAYGIENLRTRLEREAVQSALHIENEKNLALLRNASDGIHILDGDGNVIEASDSFCSMLGYSRQEMIGMNVDCWDAHFSDVDLKRALKRQFEHPARAQFETRHRRKDGSTIDVEISGCALQLKGQPVLFNSSRDISLRKRAEEILLVQQQQLRQSETQCRELLTNLHTAIVVHAPDTRIIFSNPRACALLGLSQDQMNGKVAVDRAWRFITEQGVDMQPEEYPVMKVLTSGRPLEALVVGVRMPAHGPSPAPMVWLLVNAFPEFDIDGKVKQVVVNFDDISARKQAEEKVYSLAFFDALTSLPNRRLLMDRLDTALAASARSKLYGAVLFIDMDRFKTINDVLGHQQGDALLVEVAQRIQRCVRHVDTVARLGGDEFVVLLAELDEQAAAASQKAASIAEKIRAALNQPHLLNGMEQHSSSSIGASLFCGADELAESLLRQADIAMYKAKDAGRNTLRFFNPAMQLAVQTRAALESDLRHAVPYRELRLYYQIQVDCDHRILGAEALVRWLHPRRGMVPPMEFIPLAEESMLILEIGNWVLTTACQQLALWAQSASTRHLTLSVNVSAQQFQQADFVDTIATVLRQHQVAPSSLKLELTESVVLNDVDDVVTKMHALKAMGVKLSMDDFGTGYSSLSYLKLLPLDEIKIDQSFVRDILTDANDAVMVRTIIDLAKNFGLHVIAEGVETEPQLAFLQHHGCLAYQGYLFSRPVAVEGFEDLLRLVR